MRLAAVIGAVPLGVALCTIPHDSVPCGDSHSFHCLEEDIQGFSW